MSSLLLDTSAVIGLIERGSLGARAVISDHTGPLYVSAITIGELEHGVHAADTPAVERQRLSSLGAVLESCDVANVDRHVSSVYGDLTAQLRTMQVADRRVGVADRWIASTAISLGAQLVTQDRTLVDALDGTTFGSAWCTLAD